MTEKADILYIVIPAYNEENNISSVVNGWYKLLSDKADLSRMLINISGSTDSTLDILREAQVMCPKLEILNSSKNTYKDKLMDLYNYAAGHGADYIFQTDSDGQTDPGDFNSFWERRKEYDIIIGHRKIRGDGFGRRLVQYAECAMLGIFFHIKVPDANTPFRLMKTDILAKYLRVIPASYSMPNILLTAFFALGAEKLSFLEISFTCRKSGKNTMNIKKIILCGIESLFCFNKIRKKIKDGTGSITETDEVQSISWKSK